MGLRGSLTEFDRALEAYTDEDGLILERPNSSPGPDTGNGLHGLAVANIIRFKREELTREHVFKYIDTVRSCEVKAWSQADRTPGLYHRGPRKTGELTAHDDYRMTSACSRVIGAPFAAEIAAYGRVHHWAFDNLSPGRWEPRTWHRRFPGVVPAYLLNAGEAIGELESFGLALGIWLNAWSRNAGSRILWWATIEAVRGRIGLVDEAIAVWEQSLKSTWYHGMADVMADYYDDGHPFARFYPGAAIYEL
jgi:hypothetical protein